MTITVKFFASLAERVGQKEMLISSEGLQTANDVWAKCAPDNQRPGNALVAINKEYCSFDTLVKEGDEVAFFPPVTGG